MHIRPAIYGAIEENVAMRRTDAQYKLKPHFVIEFTGPADLGQEAPIVEFDTRNTVRPLLHRHSTVSPLSHGAIPSHRCPNALYNVPRTRLVDLDLRIRFHCPRLLPHTSPPI